MTDVIYRLNLERLVRERTGETVLNGSADHASLINECMFAHAHKKIDILSRRLSPEIFGTPSIVEAMNAFARKPGCQLRILVEELAHENVEKHPILTKLDHATSGEVRKIPQAVAEQVDVNFTTMDEDSYRFEQDKRKAVAVAAFGDREGFTKQLSAYFDNIWEVSESFH